MERPKERNCALRRDVKNCSSACEANGLPGSRCADPSSDLMAGEGVALS